MNGIGEREFIGTLLFLNLMMWGMVFNNRVRSLPYLILAVILTEAVYHYLFSFITNGLTSIYFQA